MKRFLLILLLTISLCTSGWADNTHSTGDPQKEMGYWFGDGFTPFVFSGCLPTVPASSLTFGAFACAAYVDGSNSEFIYVTQAAVTLTLANTTGNHWLAIYKDTSSAVAGWTRRAGSHYLFRQASTQPATPTGGLVVAKVTVAGGVITTITPLGTRGGAASLFSISGIHSAKEWGMTGNSTDVTNALTQAIADMPATGGKIIFQTGTYIISSTIDLKDTSNITFECATVSQLIDNAQACTIQYTGASGSLFTFNGAVGTVFRGFNLTYTDAAYTAEFITMGQGTGGQDASRILIEFCRIGGLSTSSKTASTLIKVGEEAYDVTIRDSVLLNADRGIRGSTVTVINSNIVTIERNLFLPTFNVAMIQAGGTTWNIIGNTFEPRTPLHGSATNVETIGVRNLNYIGNWHGDSNDATTIWLQTTAGIVQGLYIAGNNFEDNSASGTDICVSLGPAVGVTIVGNYFNCSINVSGGSASDVTMTGNFHGGGTTVISGNPTGQSLINTNASFAIGPDVQGIQTSPLLSVRSPSNGNSLEWGHPNTGGYQNVLGDTTGTGHGFVCLSCEQGTDQNTYRTRGKVGRVIENDLAGRMVFGAAVDSNTNNQTLTSHMRLDVYGNLEFGGTSGSTVSLGSCGTSPSIAGTNVAGRITVGTTMGTTCAVVFGGAGYANTPVCLSQPVGSTDTTVTQSVTTAGFTIAKTGGGNLTDSNVHAYICVGRY